MSFRDFLFLIPLAGMWGGSFLFIKLALPYLESEAIVFWRMAVAALLLAPLALKRTSIVQNWKLFPHYLVIGFTNSTLPYFLLTEALKTLGAGETAIIQGVLPMVSMLLAYFWLREPLDRAALFGIPLGVAGVTLLVWGEVSFNPGEDGFAAVLALIAVAAYSYASIYTRRYLPSGDPFATAAFTLGIGALLVVPFMGSPLPEAPMPLEAWVGMAGLSLGSTALAYLGFFYMLNKIGPVKIATLAFMIPCFGVLWGVLFLGESLDGQTLFAFTVILLSMVLTTGILRAFR